MKALFRVVFLMVAASSCVARCLPQAQDELDALLSNRTAVTTTASPLQQRWSDYAAPQAALYAQVYEEAGVSTIVKFANLHNYTFLLQNGGNGWADTFDLWGCSILIDISALNQISFNNDRTEARIQGGARVEDMVAAAYQNDTRLATATCNCLGFLGAALGGGLARTAGLYGWSVDQLVSANVVLATGELVHVSPTSYPDLWWALGGAAANFGIVTSATVRSYPVPASENVAWTGFVAFPDDKVEAVFKAIGNLDLQPNMQIDTAFATTGAPDYTPMFAVLPFFIGNASAAEAAFAPILDLGPIANQAQETSYINWNKGSNFCDKGFRKPAYGASLARLDATTWAAVYEDFKAFIASNATAFGATTIISENYPTARAVSIGNATSSYPFRHLPSHAIALPLYADAAHDEKANAWAAKIRSMWHVTAGTARNSSYINFAHGDEPLETIYGDSLPCLQHLKQVYDPLNRFNQWFPITPHGSRPEHHHEWVDQGWAA